MKTSLSVLMLVMLSAKIYSQPVFSFDSVKNNGESLFEGLYDDRHFSEFADNMFSGGEWNQTFSIPGIRGIIYATATDGINLYVGGNFKIAGNIIANSIAKWDGEKWSSVGEGDENGVSGEIPSVHALAWSDGKLFAGGQFTKAGQVEVSGIAYFDGEKWNQLGEGVRRIVEIDNDTLILNGFIWALLAKDKKIYAGGSFDIAGNDTTGCAAVWDIASSKWEPLQDGLKGINDDYPVSVYAFAADSDMIYVGGSFRYAGNIPAENIAGWNGTEWISLGKIDHFISDIEVDSRGNLYVASKGNPQYEAGESGLMRWNGDIWTPIKGPENYKTVVSSIEIIDSLIYAGGSFDTDDYGGDYSFAVYNGRDWNPIPGLNRTRQDREAAYIVSLEQIGNSIYVSGEFTKAGNKFPVNIVEYNITQSDWRLMPGVSENDLGLHDGYIRTMTKWGDTLYAGGTFTVVGGTEAHNIAMFTNNKWYALGNADSNGINGWVYTILAEGSNLFVGGSFDRAGPEASYHIAGWNGKKWFPLGIGVGGVSGAEVKALAKVNDYIYAGGYFSVTGDVENYELPSNSFARYNLKTERWESLGDGIRFSDGSPGIVYDIELDGDRIIVAGEFDMAGEKFSQNIAFCDGNDWLSTDNTYISGIDGTIRVVKVIDSIIYIGGFLFPVADEPSVGILRLSGSDWVPVGEPFAQGDWFVNDIAEFDTGFFAGGYFNTQQGDLNNLAWFDGISWSTIGGGVFPGVSCMAAFSDRLYVGGPMEIITRDGLNAGIAQFDYKLPIHTIIQKTYPDSNVGNYPNPFEGSTVIYFNLEKPEMVRIQLFDNQGRHVRDILKEQRHQGKNEIIFHSGDLVKGSYYYRLITLSYSATGKMTIR